MADALRVLEQIAGIWRRRDTGVLTLVQDEANVRLFFERGLISAAASNIRERQLGRFLAARGCIEPGALAALVEGARSESILLGQAAVLWQLIQPIVLIGILRDQAVALLTHALDLDFRVAGFAPSPASFYMPARMSLDQLVLELARHSPAFPEFEPDQKISLRPHRKLPRLPWHPNELCVLKALAEPRTIPELLSVTGVDSAKLGKVLSTVHALGLMSFSDSAPDPETALVRVSQPFEYKVPEINKAGISEKIEVLHDRAAFASEQFKALKIRLGQLGKERRLQVIAVSSPTSEDGKSLVSANLAACFARDYGRRTLLLDCDLRNPSVHRYMGVAAVPGLLGALEADHREAHRYMRRLGQLHVMTSGGIAAYPVELLSHSATSDMLAFLRGHFDTIIIDSPPFLPITDAEVLTRLADGLLVVVRCGRTAYGSVEQALRNADRDKLLGVVLNDVLPTVLNTRYDHRYYGYRYRGMYPYGPRRKPRSRRTQGLDLH